MEFNFSEGKILLFNKPLHWTSFDVVNKIRYAIKVKKVGHAGTLDPLATGLLIVCTGKFTKIINEIQGQEKEYTGSITLGATTPSYDLETEIVQTFPFQHITDKMISETTQRFIGTIQQIPPAYSAKNINGERAYKKARRNEKVIMQAREVTISKFDITNIALPRIDFRVVCSKGTYIRSLANDFGTALNNGAHLSSLCRTRIGNYTLDNAFDVLDFVEKVKNGEIEKIVDQFC